MRDTFSKIVLFTVFHPNIFNIDCEDAINYDFFIVSYYIDDEMRIIPQLEYKRPLESDGLKKPLITKSF